ncbi:MAG TPA: L,D-transpeptidase family protein [Lysobacter sp.]
MNTTTHSRTRRLHRSLLHVAALAAFAALGTPAFAADDPVSATPGVGTEAPLAPGTFEWTPEAATSGPIVVVVSLPAQMAHVYRGDTRIGRTTISSGRAGHDTPPGTYEILEKRRDHRSNLYNNAPMPFMQRLTWDGIALHGGKIPGYPASHGCVRLPNAFAAKLFEVTERGGMVIVADETNFSQAVLYPGARVPVDPWTGRETGTADTGLASLATPVATPVLRDDAPALAGN